MFHYQHFHWCFDHLIQVLIRNKFFLDSVPHEQILTELGLIFSSFDIILSSPVLIWYDKVFNVFSKFFSLFRDCCFCFFIDTYLYTFLSFILKLYFPFEGFNFFSLAYIIFESLFSVFEITAPRINIWCVLSSSELEIYVLGFTFSVAIRLF